MATYSSGRCQHNGEAFIHAVDRPAPIGMWLAAKSIDKGCMTWQEKLAEIEALALERDKVVKSRLGQDGHGGCLLLGRFYAESANIFLGLNPGLWPGATDYDFSVGPCSAAPFNSPFQNDPQCHGLSYMKNCEMFLDAHPCLRTWFENGVTSAFTSPWRSANVDELYRLNKNATGEVFRQSGDILASMIRHHDAKVFVVGAVRGPNLLTDVLTAPGKRSVSNELVDRIHGSGWYQFSEWSLTVDDSRIRVLQIPHFARANSLSLWEPCAKWLKEKLYLA